MKPKYTLAIRPRLPENLSFLVELAYNLWWEWNYDAIDLFRRISNKLWEEGKQNPVYVLVKTDQERIDYLAREEGFLNHLARVRDKFNSYIEEPRWFQKHHPETTDAQFAYFSAEYGLTTCLPIYSGGLGVLSGDHLKTASDMGLPLVAIGLAYRQGYFHQYLNIDGWQQERYDENDLYSMPVEKVVDDSGNWLKIDVPYLSRPVKAGLWRVNVGRIPLYLLSTNLEENAPEDREITDQLYGGDSELRIRQEIVLGIGGVIALRTLKINSTAFHVNEGHSAFLSLERMKGLMQKFELEYSEARNAAYSSMCFTTHTPVPAGNDVFDAELVKKYLADLAAALGLSWEQFAALGQNGHQSDASFSMTITALRNAAWLNGVSRLHGHVSRGMWEGIWPGLLRSEVPVRPITNGIHTNTWISHDLEVLFDRYVGHSWRSDPLREDLWERIGDIPDEELWRTHGNRRTRLVAFARKRLQQQLIRRGASGEEIARASEVLHPDALTIGFARRFATYKRATLLFNDLDRLKQLVNNREQPVQFIFAGKAHPKDDGGKDLIRQLIHNIRDNDLRDRFVFVEDYDLEVGRYLVQGCDVWLNTPRRPLEASGTSGMKSVANGGIHLSVPDGWWAEAYTPEVGWSIGNGEEYDDHDYQDLVEGNALYDLLEGEVVPLFYQRNVARLPREWVSLMKRSMSQLIPRFSAGRMLRDYVEQSYLPAHHGYSSLSANSFSSARQLAGWQQSVDTGWEDVEISDVKVSSATDLLVGDAVEVVASVNCGSLAADDLLVEACHGPVDSKGNFAECQTVPMNPSTGESVEGTLQYHAVLTAPQSGNLGITVRVFPTHPALPHKYAMFKVKWVT